MNGPLKAVESVEDMVYCNLIALHRCHHDIKYEPSKNTAAIFRMKFNGWFSVNFALLLPWLDLLRKSCLLYCYVRLVVGVPFAIQVLTLLLHALLRCCQMRQSL